MESNATATKAISVGDISIGGGSPLVLIAGPCVIESERLVMETAAAIRELVASLNMPFVFKSSYTKMNRMSQTSFTGPGIGAGLKILAKVREQVGVPVLTDVHSPEDAARAAEVVDIVQIPAFLCRQTDLALAAGRTGKPVNIKKGQFLAPEDMGPISEKIASTGNTRILLTERGTSFGYHNLVVDMRSLVVLRRFGYPVIFDATHSVQLPGDGGSHSGGEPSLILPLARAAVAVGVDALFIETHPCVGEALCDAKSMLPLDHLEELLVQILSVDAARKKDAAAWTPHGDVSPVAGPDHGKASKIRLIVLDVDGVLTDGSLLFDHDGELGKRFNVHDGMGIRLALRAGIRVALVSGRASAAVVKRAAELGIEDCFAGISDKMAAYEELMKKYRLRDEDVAYVGDDVEDIGVLRRAGFAVAVGNAVPSVKREAHYVTRAEGGAGAVREAVDFILQAQEKKVEPRE